MAIEKSKVLICLPTYNEAENVEFMVKSIRNIFDGYLILIDGFSTDNTVEIARSLNVPVFIRDAPGKGAAMQKALQIAHKEDKEFVLFIDCDRSYDAKDIEKFLSVDDNPDLVIGARSFKSIKPLSRVLGNIFTTGLINIFHFSSIKDSMTGMKLLKTEKFLNILKEDSFFIDPLICIEALRMKMNIKQIQILHNERVGNSKMSFMNGFVLIPRFLKKLLSKR